MTRDVPNFALVAGVPARRVGWVGEAGQRLIDLGRGYWQCPQTEQRYEECESGPCAIRRMRLRKNSESSPESQRIRADLNRRVAASSSQASRVLCLRRGWWIPGSSWFAPGYSRPGAHELGESMSRDQRAWAGFAGQEVFGCPGGELAEDGWYGLWQHRPRSWCWLPWRRSHRQPQRLLQI